MPTYVYACKDCGYRFEERQEFSDPALSQCPSCQGRLRKVFSSVGVVFKGSGFYRTDSRAGASSPALATAGAKDKATDSATPSGASSSKASDASSSASQTGSSSSAKPAPVPAATPA